MWDDSRRQMFQKRALVYLKPIQYGGEETDDDNEEININNNTEINIFDFNNYYANIAINWELEDDFVLSIIKLMSDLRSGSKQIKLDIVSFIGKSKYINELFFNMVKILGVAMMYNIIENNSKKLKILGSATDGFFVKNSPPNIIPELIKKK